MQEENLAKGMHDGEVLWVCDLRYRDYADKPIRHIKPTKVLVRSNKMLEGKKKIYYSDSHFVAFGKFCSLLYSGIFIVVYFHFLFD